MTLLNDPRAQGIIKTLRDAGLSDLQINNAFVVLDNGGSATEAEKAIHMTLFPVIADFEMQAMMAAVERELELVELVERKKETDKQECMDVYPNGAKAWPSNY